MFSKLFFVRDPQSMVRIVVEGLYPSEYLEQADRDDPSRTNRQRIEEVRNFTAYCKVVPGGGGICFPRLLC